MSIGSSSPGSRGAYCVIHHFTFPGGALVTCSSSSLAMVNVQRSYRRMLASAHNPPAHTLGGCVDAVSTFATSSTHRKEHRAMGKHSLPVGLGKRLKQAIKAAGGTRRISRASGIHESVIYRYFNGWAIPSHRLYALARLCNVSAAWLFGETPHSHKRNKHS